MISIVIMSNNLKPNCLDCGMSYQDFPLDTTLSNDQWLMIHPERDGLLCAGCIVKRAAKLPGIIVVKARFVFVTEYD